MVMGVVYLRSGCVFSRVYVVKLVASLGVEYGVKSMGMGNMVYLGVDMAYLVGPFSNGRG